MATKGQQSDKPFNHLGNFGRGGRYEVYAGAPPGGQGMQPLSMAANAPNNADENLLNQLLAMGFQRENAERALALYNNDLERSIDGMVKDQALADL